MYSSTITAATAAALLPLTSAFTIRQTSSPPAYKFEQAFGLIARVTKPATTGSMTDVEGFSVTSGHIGAGEDATLLVPSSGGAYNLKPDTYYGNGTTSQIESGTGSVVRTPMGQYPYSWIIYSNPNATSGLRTGINIGDGSFGVHVSGVSYTGPSFPDSQPYFAYDPIGVEGSKSQFYACDGQFYQSTVPFIYWRNQTTETPAECAEVKLLPQCMGDVANATHFTQTVACYDDAATVTVLKTDSTQ